MLALNVSLHQIEFQVFRFTIFSHAKWDKRPNCGSCDFERWALNNRFDRCHMTFNNVQSVFNIFKLIIGVSDEGKISKVVKYF